MSDPAHNVCPSHRVSRQIYAPVFSDWEFDIGRKVGSFLRGRFYANFLQLSNMKHECNVLQGLGYRGPEVETGDNFDLMMQVLEGFAPPDLHEVHYVSSHPLHDRYDALSFSLKTASKTLTSLTIDYTRKAVNHPRVELCTVLKEGWFPNLNHLDISVPGICPTLVEALSQRRIASPKQWSIQTAPYICSRWMEERTGIANRTPSLTFAFLSEFIDKARAAVISNPDSPLANTLFSIDATSFLDDTIGSTLISRDNTATVDLPLDRYQLVLEFALHRSARDSPTHLSDFTFHIAPTHRSPRKSRSINSAASAAKEGPSTNTNATGPGITSEEHDDEDDKLFTHTFTDEDGRGFLERALLLERSGLSTPDRGLLREYISSYYASEGPEWEFYNIVQLLVLKDRGLTVRNR